MLQYCSLDGYGPFIYAGILMPLLLLAGMILLGALYAVAKIISDLPRFNCQHILVGFEREAESFPHRMVRKLTSANAYWIRSGLIALGYMGLTTLIHTLLCQLKG